MIFDVVIIGAGQAGLSMGYYIKQSSKSFLIVDHHQRIGDVWRNRYDSLTLFTSRSYSSLPGLSLKGDSEGFPTKNEVADYLENYAKTFNLPIEGNTNVERVYKEGELFYIQAKQAAFTAKNVIVATGPFHTPRVPAFSLNLPNEIVQLHSSEYKSPDQLQAGSVLVVGGGNSGSQIAVELSKDRETYLSVGQKIRFLPLRYAGKNIFWWFDKIGLLKAPRDSWIGHRLQKQGDPIFGFELKEKMAHGSIKLKGRTIGSHDEIIHFDDQSTLKVKNIIWATGFQPNYAWIDIPGVIDPNGQVRHNRGISNVEGLYFLGLPWQYRRGSALLIGVGEDAHYLNQHIIDKRQVIV